MSIMIPCSCQVINRKYITLDKYLPKHLCIPSQQQIPGIHGHLFDSCNSRYSLNLIFHCVPNAILEHSLQRMKGLIALYAPIVRSAMFNFRNYN